jgi:hypothetical protein
MLNIKHSKFKNTGLIFELLVRKITADTLSGGDSPASKILKKYFVNTELGKEYKIYDSLLKNSPISEGKANIVINTILESSKKLNRTALRKEKYNLIKEIKEYYNVEEFFKIKLPNYKVLAAVYNLMELNNSTEIVNPEQIVNNKLTLLEYLTKENKSEGNKEEIIEEFKSYSKDLRILTYKLLLEKFNSKYSTLNNNQKVVLREFINSIDSTPKLKEYYNSKVNEIKDSLHRLITKVEDTATKIKLEEVVKLIKEVDKNQKIDEDNLVDLLQYYELLEELQKIHK